MAGGVAHDAVVQDLSKHAAAPVRAQRGAQAGKGFVHPLAGRRLAADRETDAADAQHFAARVLQVDTTYHEIRAPARGRNVFSELARYGIPRVTVDDRHLTATAAIDVAFESLSRDRGRLTHLVHLFAVSAFQPNRFQSSHDKTATKQCRSLLRDCSTLPRTSDACGRRRLR